MPITIRLNEIANAIVTRIAAGPWDIGAVTASRRYSVEYSLSDLAALKVNVQPLGQKDYEEDRDGQLRTDYFVQIGIQKRVPATLLNDDIDPLAGLVRQISDTWAQGVLYTVTAELKVTENSTILYTPKELDVNKKFFGLIMLTLSEWRDAGED